MEQATRTLFPNYFNGSEMVIAGKLVDRDTDRLHVEVTASNRRKFVVLKTDVPLAPQTAGNDGPAHAGPGGHHAGDPNPLERLWSYLTVKELLSSWLQSDDPQERQQLRQEAQALAVNSRFLTPFTAMRLRESPPRPPARGLEEPAGPEAATGPHTVTQSPRGPGPQPGKEAPSEPLWTSVGE